MGFVGLSNTIAREGAKYNIHCNTIVPTSASRLTQGIIPDGVININFLILFLFVHIYVLIYLYTYLYTLDVLEGLKPELIAPVVLWLCHEGCTDNGSVVDAAAVCVAKCK